MAVCVCVCVRARFLMACPATQLKAELPDELVAGPASSVPHVKATQVTTRTALTKEDKDKNSTTSQIEEKTFTATTRTTAHRQEQRVVTQEVRTATILTSAEPTQVGPRFRSSTSFTRDPTRRRDAAIQGIAGASCSSLLLFLLWNNKEQLLASFLPS